MGWNACNAAARLAVPYFTAKLLEPLAAHLVSLEQSPAAQLTEQAWLCIESRSSSNPAAWPLADCRFVLGRFRVVQVRTSGGGDAQ